MVAEAAAAARVVVRHAQAADEPGIRALLRSQAIGGTIRVSLEREPDLSLAAGVEGDRHAAIVAHDTATDAIVGVGSRSVREAYVNGEPRRLGYLGLLRRDAALRGRVRMLARGFDLLEQSRRADELPFDLTAIVSDNAAARRLLERGLPGLARYHHAADLVTLVMPTSADPAPPQIRRGSADLLPAISHCLQRNLARYQFAPVWRPEHLRSPTLMCGLAPTDFFVAMRGGQVMGCLALWDQRAFKQTVIRGYAPRLARWRPLINPCCAITGRPRLPEVGRQLNAAFSSHVAIDGDDAGLLLDLLRAALRAARDAGLEHVVLGLAEGNTMLSPLRRAFRVRGRRRAREYLSTLYTVSPAGSSPPRLDGRTPHVEVATL